MNRTRAIRRSAAALVGLTAAALLAVIAATPAAFADPVPFQSHAHADAAAAGATPGWQVAPIVGGAVLVVAAIAVLAERAWAAQRRVSTMAA
jgi:hypothetical protein